MCIRLITAVSIVFSVSLLGCSENLHRYDYAPKEDFPRMVYIGNEVQPLNTQTELPKEKQFFVEVRKKNGENQYGKLIKITETELVVSLGYHYTAVNDSTFKEENRAIIPKKDVFILKVF